MFYSYHVHSRWSDGEGEIIDFIRAAKAMELDEVGISDHYVLTPGGKIEPWSMPLDALDDYVEAVQDAACEGGEETVVRLGIEADYFPETANELRGLLLSHPFDYIIGSVHRLDGFPIDDVAEDWQPLSQAEKDDIIRRYWIRLKEMAESRMFDIAAHLDLAKKFAVWPSIDLTTEIDAALDAVAAAGMSFEINTSGWYKPCKEQYPSLQIIEGCRDRGIPVLVTADAHTPAHLIRDFDRAFKLIKDAGFDSVASYGGRQMIVNPIG